MEIFDWLIETFSSREALRIYIESYGPHAPAAFIFIQALQVVLAPIPGEMTGSIAGFIFGGGLGSVYATIGLTIGSTIAFIFGKLFGRPLVRRFVSEKVEKKFEFMKHEQGYFAVLIIFFIPGFPKDVLTYLVALSPMRTLPFVVISNLGRLPGTVLLTYAGSAAYEGSWGVLIGIGCASALLVAVAFFYRETILRRLKR